MDYLLKTREILSGCLFIPIDKISEDATINEIKNLDSLAFEMIIAEMENFLQKEIDVMDLIEIRSVKDMAKILEKYHESAVN